MPTSSIYLEQNAFPVKPVVRPVMKAIKISVLIVFLVIISLQTKYRVLLPVRNASLLALLVLVKPSVIPADLAKIREYSLLLAAV